MLSIAGMHHGGAERVVATLCNNLDKDKYSVIVSWRTSRGQIGEDLVAQGFEVIGLPELKPDVTPYRRFLVLKQQLKDRRIDIIHTHDTGALTDAAQCRLMGSKVKLVHTFHFGNYPNLKRSNLAMEMIFSRVANSLVPVGFEQAKLICKTLHLSLAKLETIYNGVESPVSDVQDDFLAPYRKKIDENAVIIGSISTLTEQKGITYLLDVAEMLKSRGVNCVFFIAGDGPLRQELENKCKELNITDMVYFLGWVPNAVSNLLPSLDIFCQSSLWEANSIVLLEAMATGVPIVTTDVGESKHVVDEGVNGRVVEPRDTKSMAEALIGLINNPERRKTMAENSQNKYLNKYTIDKMVGSYEALYEGLI